MARQLLSYSLIVVFIFSTVNCLSQTPDSSAKVVFSGYVDAYYAYYTDSVGPDNYQQFPTIDPRSKTFGLNTAMVSAQYNAEKVSGVISLHYGDIAKSAWSPAYNNILEANVSVRLLKKWWLSAGFFRTHFGTEGLFPKENITSSIAVNTYYEPYYESGLRLKYEASEKLVINLYLLNGYNLFEDNNEKKSAGVLATYTFRENFNIGYDNYIGDDSPQGDSISHLRIHQNLFMNYQFRKFKVQIGGDYCIQENSKLNDNTKSASMVGGQLSVKYQAFEKSAVYARGEIINDPDGFMTGVQANNKGLDLKGITLGYEYKPTDNSYIRFEWRSLTTNEDQKIFYFDGKSKNSRSEYLFNIGVSF